MREKDIINLKNKMNFKNLLVKKTQHSFNLQRINIQTINKDKNQNYINERQKFMASKISNQIGFLNSTLTNNNLNNNYILNDEQISFFSLYNSNKEPSSINSLNSSPYSTYTKKKSNYKRLQKKCRNKYNNFNINSSNSINNLSLNSKIINTNQSVSLDSSSPSSYNDSSDSSCSYRARENRRKNYKELMMAEEDNMDYLRRREVGLFSSDEEENNTSFDNNNYLEENFSNEIERILIEIYNKNISIISSGNNSSLNKYKNENEEIEKQMKKYLKKKNIKTNLLALKCLSNKIKELVGKYKEKVFEIEEIKTIYETSQMINNQLFHCNNSVGSNVATNSNTSYENDSNINDEENYIKNSSLLNFQDEIVRKGIFNVLLRELVNIKKTLKISSKEIENIFKYPLSLLRNKNGKKIKFSFELMQIEEFCKTLLNDEFISALLIHMKRNPSQISISKINNLLEQVFEDCDHNNEMTRFENFINEKLGITKEFEVNNNENENDNYLDEIKGKENSNNNNALEEQIGDNSEFNLDIGSSNENKNSNDLEEFNDNNIIDNESNVNSGKKSPKKKKQKKVESEDSNNKIEFQDIDELLNYINDETDSKKGKNKKKRKKNKKHSGNKEDEKINDVNNNDKDNDEDFDKIFEEFKKDIENNTIYVYNINKIKPVLSEDFITNKCSN
jgi:hypothetical protein